MWRIPHPRMDVAFSMWSFCALRRPVQVAECRRAFFYFLENCETQNLIQNIKGLDRL